MTDSGSQVDKLKRVSDDRLWKPLTDPSPFDSLVVRALHNNDPMEGARVTRSITDDPEYTGVTVSSGLIFPGSGEVVRVITVAGNKKGRPTVAATCNEQFVSFSLTIFLTCPDLTPLPNKIPAVQSTITTKHQTARVRLITRDNDNEFWPGIPCRFQQAMAITTDRLIANTSVINDSQGWSPRSSVYFSKAPPKGSQGEVSYQACLPGNDTSFVTVTMPLNAVS